LPITFRLIAGFYDKSKVNVTADDVVIAPGTTGANALIFQGLIKPGDHVVCAYPAYEALVAIPNGLGAEVSYWQLDPNNDWQGSLDDLKSLLRPDTKMIILNNPHNPTGAVLSTKDQAEIIKLASKHNTIVFADEIFRPLFHTGEVPLSIIEHGSYDRTMVAGSLSKVWGFAGVRIGWVVTRNAEVRENIIKARKWNVQTVSVIDEGIAKEVLSERCCQKVIDVTLANARANLAVLESFVKNNQKAVWSYIPKGASTAFVKFMNPKTGEPVDDVELCRRLRDDDGLLLSPGSLTFGTAKKGDLKGFVRVHLTGAPERFKDGIKRIEQFVVTSKMEELSV
jgi:aspartate/methionine/tyrosine aminotransferase